MVFNILAINPGSTSTKIAWFRDEDEVWRETVRHDPHKIAEFAHVADQYEFRLGTIEEAVNKHNVSFDDLHAVVGRGGVIDPIPGGTYRVNQALIERSKLGKPWDHASNLGCIIADAIAQPRNIPAFIVDPVAVDEMDEYAKITGLPELPKHSLSHALNIKSTVRMASRDLEKDWKEMNFVVVHLGGGISVCAHRKGKMVDLNSGNDFGPFSPERTGGLPAGDLARICYSGEYNLKDMLKKLVGYGGIMAYLGTSDMREVRKRINEGDEKARLVVNSMVFQICKEIGAQATSMAGKVDAILVTGGVAYDTDMVAAITEKVQWIAPVLVYPGEDEMKPLALGGLRVLKGEEEPESYSDYHGGNE
ncbi:MAG: butyrate kinase [Synergistales bacterium]|nr:butyrate kinase [Synergistales bacterium]